MSRTGIVTTPTADDVDIWLKTTPPPPPPPVKDDDGNGDDWHGKKCPFPELDCTWLTYQHHCSYHKHSSCVDLDDCPFPELNCNLRMGKNKCDFPDLCNEERQEGRKARFKVGQIVYPATHCKERFNKAVVVGRYHFHGSTIIRTDDGRLLKVMAGKLRAYEEDYCI